MNRGFQSEFLSYVNKRNQDTANASQSVQDELRSPRLRQPVPKTATTKSVTPRTLVAPSTSVERSRTFGGQQVPSTSSLSSSRKTHRARKVTPSDEGIGKLLAARINKMPSKESVAEKSMDQEMDDNESVSSSQKGSPPVEQLLANRPKRSIVPKNMDFTSGLSWKEETELNKALYASLQEVRKQNSQSNSEAEDDPEEQVFPSRVRVGRRVHPKNLTLKVKRDKDALAHCKDESSQDSVRSSEAEAARESYKSSRAPVHAQRKFAQGSLPCSPNTTPLKVKTTPKKLFSHKQAKTEDFLTFLCLRGSSVLPPSLDFFTLTPEGRCETAEGGAHTPGRNGSSNGRSSSPTPSRASSDLLDITEENYDLGVQPLPKDEVSASPRMKSTSPTKFHRKTPSPPPDLTPVTPPSSAATSKKSRQPPPLIPMVPLCKSQKDKAKKQSAATNNVKKKIRVVSRSKGAHKIKLRTRQSEVNAGKKGRRELVKVAMPTGKPRQERLLRAKSSKKHKLARDANKKLKKLKKASQKPVNSAPVTRSSKDLPQPPSGNNKKTELKRPRDEIPDYPVRKRAINMAETRKLREGIPAKRAKIKSRSLDKKADSNTPTLASLKSMRSRAESDKKVPASSPVRAPSVITRKQQESDSSTPSPGNSSMALRNTASAESTSQLTMPVRKSAMLHVRGISVKRELSPLFKKKGRTAGSPKKSVTSEKTSESSSSSGHKDPEAGEGSTESGSSGKKVKEVPVYRPTKEEFQDPLAFITSIQSEAEAFGMAKIIPPAGWKPECKVSDEMRFMAQMQYIHKLQERWGPNVQQMECIRRHLHSQGVRLDQPPWIGGIEVDLPRLSKVIQDFGGMQNVIDKKKWNKVADILRIPKLALDRTTKLYDAYCKFLLSYDTQTPEEKQKIEQQVLAEWKKGRLEEEDCVTKGRSTSLNGFHRIARNTMFMFFKEKDDPSPEVVEAEYWKIVQERTNHVAVQCGHVDTKNCGSGFPMKKDSPYSKHGWNFNMLANNSSSILRHVGPVSGVTVPTLHIGMLFSTSCWSTDPHLLPYIMYLHTGADIIWYCIPQNEEEKLQDAMESIAPNLLTDHPIWLPEDTAMVNPKLLVEKDISVSRTVQTQGEFVVVFSNAYTSMISCGYNICESIHYALPDWIPLGTKAAKMLNESCEPELFSMERLVCSLARNDKTPVSALNILLSQLEKIVKEEIHLRKQLFEAGLHSAEKMSIIEDPPLTPGKRKRSMDSTEEVGNICEISKKVCYLSMVVNDSEDAVYSLKHALTHIQRRKNLKACKLMYRHEEKELEDLLSGVRSRISAQHNVPQSPKKRGAKK